MKVIIDKQAKIAEIYVYRNTPEELVQQKIAECKALGMYPAVYRAGEKNVLDVAKELLKANI